jgi:hypothetical protein
VLPVVAVGVLRLLLHLEQEISHDQVIHLFSHEAAISILRAEDDWFAPDVEARVDDDTVTGAPEEGIDELPISRVNVLVDGLDSGGIVNVSDGRHIRAEVVETVVQRGEW